MLSSAKIARDVAESRRIPGKKFTTLSYSDAAVLERALRNDSLALYQVALASLFEAIHGVSSCRYSWSKVKLYFATFSAIRTLLMLESISVFYIGTSPYTTKASAGAGILRASGNTHSVVFNEFKKYFGGSVILSQSIGGEEPFSWLGRIRNDISYNTAPFLDPDVPKELEKISKNLRMSLDAYISDEEYLYTFDEDHALVAYPIFVMKHVREAIRKNDLIPETLDPHYIKILSSIRCHTPSFLKLM